MRPLEPWASVQRQARRAARVRRWEGSPHRRAARMAAVVTALAVAGPAAYTVERGDTLSGIAARHGTTVDALVRLNAIDDPDRIVAGQRLELPEQAAASSRPAARADVGALIEDVARSHGWSPRFVKALAWQEPDGSRSA